MSNKPILHKKPHNRLRLFLGFWKRTISDDIFSLGAQCAFYLILTVVPCLSLGLILTSSNPEIIEGLLNISAELLPAEAAQIVADLLNQTIAASTNTLFSFSALIALFLLLRTVIAIMKALNKAYNVTETRSVLNVLGRAFFATVAIIPAILLAMALIIFGKTISFAIWDAIGFNLSFAPLWNALRYLLTGLILFTFFTLIYRYLPNHEMQWSETFPGAITATGGWWFTSGLFAWYVNNFSNFAVTYGGLAGVFILLSWFYITSIIIMLGGEVNAYLADLRTNRP